MWKSLPLPGGCIPYSYLEAVFCIVLLQAPPFPCKLPFSLDLEKYLPKPAVVAINKVRRILILWRSTSFIFFASPAVFSLLTNSCCRMAPCQDFKSEEFVERSYLNKFRSGHDPRRTNWRNIERKLSEVRASLEKNKLAKLRRHASRVHFAKIHFW